VADPGDAVAFALVVLTGLGAYIRILEGALKELVVVERRDLDLRVAALPGRDLSCEWPGSKCSGPLPS
jgi:hypothetical protein